MRMFVQDHGVPREQSIRKALAILLKAGIYSGGGGMVGDRPAIIVNAESVRNAVKALNKAGMRTVIE